MNELGDRTRFTFTPKEQILAEIITPNPAISMYWEKSKEMCPHCKELILKGEHYEFLRVEIWIPYDIKVTDCALSDLTIIGKAETTLMLSKDKIKEALVHSKVFNKFSKTEK